MTDFARALVWETEGRQGAAERGWLGEEARQAEEARQTHADLNDVLSILSSVAAQLGVSAAALAEDASLAVRDRDLARVELAAARSRLEELEEIASFLRVSTLDVQGRTTITCLWCNDRTALPDNLTLWALAKASIQHQKDHAPCRETAFKAASNTEVFAK